MAEFVKFEKARSEPSGKGGPAYVRKAAITAVLVQKDTADVYVGNTPLEVARQEWEGKAREILGRIHETVICPVSVALSQFAAKPCSCALGRGRAEHSGSQFSDFLAQRFNGRHQPGFVQHSESPVYPFSEHYTRDQRSRQKRSPRRRRSLSDRPESRHGSGGGSRSKHSTNHCTNSRDSAES